MKKIIGFLALAALLTVVSCTDKAPEAQKEVIVVPAAPVIIVKDPPAKEPAKGTTITFDKKGVKIETKKDNK
jgi:hypothetical protein